MDAHENADEDDALLPDPWFIAKRLNALFNTVLNPETGKPFTNLEVAQYCRERIGHGTKSYISRLRNPNPNAPVHPSLQFMECLAQRFGFNVSVFSPNNPRSLEEILQQLQDKEKLGPGDVQVVLMAARALMDISPEEAAKAREQLLAAHAAVSERVRQLRASSPLSPQFRSAHENREGRA